MNKAIILVFVALFATIASAATVSGTNYCGTTTCVSTATKKTASYTLDSCIQSSPCNSAEQTYIKVSHTAGNNYTLSIYSPTDNTCQTLSTSFPVVCGVCEYPGGTDSFIFACPGTSGSPTTGSFSSTLKVGFFGLILASIVAVFLN
eukprot:TRINITY_DN2830_c0_g1_i1.p1 TRINITY_DN2830_c0_g1~~TRINITY_DN2830_c0_g1_i1.p1  ORF type:complete len:147 (-),score=34.72 TRINITY_DN2830_c0_g1_i1:136-576(-)